MIRQFTEFVLETKLPCLILNNRPGSRILKIFTKRDAGLIPILKLVILCISIKIGNLGYTNACENLCGPFVQNDVAQVWWSQPSIPLSICVCIKVVFDDPVGLINWFFHRLGNLMFFHVIDVPFSHGPFF